MGVNSDHTGTLGTSGTEILVDGNYPCVCV